VVTSHRRLTDGNKKDIYKHILADFEILNPDTWPDNDKKHLSNDGENIRNMLHVLYGKHPINFK
jgi:hypothetical protein